MGCRGKALDAWLKTLEKALSFAPEHLSCYQLHPGAPQTPMGRRVAAGRVQPPG